MSAPALLRVAAACALVLPMVCAAQAYTSRMAPTSTRSSADPLDVRVGVAKPMDPSEPITDGGVRHAGSSQSLAVPLVLGKDYRIGPNDLMEVEVLDAENLKRTVRVNAAGQVSLPLIGQVALAGLTAQEAEERIAQRYAEKYLQNPQVSIFIKEFTTERITVEGAVSRPGIYPLTGQMTLLRTLALVGGFASAAKTSEVAVYRLNDRREKEVAIYDVEKIRSGKAEDPPIKGDDLIVVQRDSIRVLLKDSLLRDVIDSINPFSVLTPK